MKNLSEMRTRGNEIAQCGDICLFVRVDICREKLKYGNAMFTKQEGGRFTALRLVIVGISAILVDILCLLLTPSPYLKRFGAPRMWTFGWSATVRQSWTLCVCVCVCRGGINTLGTEGFTRGVCLFAVSRSFILTIISFSHSIFCFIFTPSSLSLALTLPPSHVGTCS